MTAAIAMMIMSRRGMTRAYTHVCVHIHMICIYIHVPVHAYGNIHIGVGAFVCVSVE